MRLSISVLASLLVVAILVPVAGSGTVNEGIRIDCTLNDTLSTPMTEDSLAADNQLGPVFAYGVQLARPYTFSFSEDARRLYLDGYFFGGATDTIIPKIEVSETSRAEFELCLRAGEAMKQGKTFEETLAIYAEVMRSSPLVERVRISHPWIYMTWASWPDEEEEIIIPREDSQFVLAAYLERLVAEFRYTVCSGGMVAFGRNYHVSVPTNRLPETIEQINLIRSSAPRESLDVMNTALQNKRFLEDLYHRSEDRMGEE